MYDVVIIGSGPAGATLARLIGRTRRVLLVDRRALDAPWAPGELGKPCGGLLAPAAQRELARQGLGVPRTVCSGPQLFAVRAADVARRAERLYQRFYVNVEREAFDRWLVGLVPPTVDTAFGWTLEHLERDEQGALLGFRTRAGGRVGVATRLVVGADGASSLVRRIAYPQAETAPRYVAIQAAFAPVAAEPCYGAIFDRSVTDFYGWTIPKGDRTLLGVAVPAGAGANRRFEEFASHARSLGVRLGAEEHRASAAVVRPSSLRQLLPGTGSVLLTGEAAGFISPSSAEGISYALRSGAMLADAVESGIAGADQRYSRAVAPLAANVAVKMLKSRAIYGSTFRNMALTTGIGAIAEERRQAPAAGLSAR